MIWKTRFSFHARHLPRRISRDRRSNRAVEPPAVRALEKRELLTVAVGPPLPQAGTAMVGPASASASDATTAPASQGFVPMFDGNSTAGWFNPYDSGRAFAKNGQIILTGGQKFFLVSKNTYKNFILEADILIPPDGNSGIQFRSQYRHNFVTGYQADVDTQNRNWAGGLWFEGRNWLARPAHQAPVRPGQWNHYRIEAIGDHIRIIVNGAVTVDTHQSLAFDGHIALQDHGTPGGIYRFKNVQIMDLGG